MAKTQGSVGCFGPVLGPQVAHFWRMQEMMLNEAEAFSAHWFQRRHQATRSALRAGAAFGGGDPLAGMKAITEWQAQSAQRLVEDAREYWEMVARCAGLAIREEIEATGDAAGQVVKTARGPASAHAVPV